MINSSACIRKRFRSLDRETSVSSRLTRILATSFLITTLIGVLLPSILVTNGQISNLSLSPATFQAEQIDAVFTVNLTVNEVDDLWAWKVALEWDPQIIRLAADPVEGDFLREAGSTVFLFTPPQQDCLPEISCGLLTKGGQDGSGVLATLTFRIVKETVESELAIANSTLLEAATAGSIHEEIAHSTSNCIVSLIIGEKPVAKAEVDQINPSEDIPVVFDGSKSIPTSENLTYSWSLFDEEPKILEGIAIQYIFQTPGSYTVTLTVENQRGDTANDTIIIFVKDVTPPIAIITIENADPSQTMEVGQTLTFNASKSYDPESGDIKAYQWDFGDGTTSPTPIVNHKYEHDGSYTVKLTLLDGRAGNNATATITVTVGSQQQQSFKLPITVTGILTVFTASILIGSAFWLRKRPPSTRCPSVFSSIHMLYMRYLEL